MKRLARRDPAEWMRLPQSERVSLAAEQAIEDIRAEAARKLANAQRQIMATAETEARVTRLRESFTDAPGHDGTRAESLKADFAQTDHYTKAIRREAMGNQAKPCEATGTFWVMRCYVESLAIYPVAAHRSTDYEHRAQGRRRFRHPRR